MPASEPSPEVLNAGLELALEWGQNFGKPVGPRLAVLHPELSAGQLEACELLCQEAKYFAFRVLYDLYEQGYKDPSTQQYHQPVLDKYPWISGENLNRLLTQGRYYAWRDFG